MKKLVQKNPVQRFKQGRKIIKAEDGWRLIHGKATKLNLSPDVKQSSQFLNAPILTQRYIFAGKQYGSFDGGKTYYGLDEGGRPLSYKANQQLLAAIGRRNKPKKVVDDYRGTGGTGNSSFYQFGKMGGWNRSMGSSIDQDSLNKLQEMGYDTNNINAKKIQDEINNVFGPHAVKSDDKWGNQSKAGLQALYERWKSLQPTTTETKTVDINSPSKVLNSTVINQEPLTPEQQTDKAIVNNVDNLQFKRNGNYNRSQIRNLISEKLGQDAYNYTGAQRKALRLYLNGESNDTSLLTDDLQKFIVPYKQGGQLVSRNPIQRFKQKNFRQVVQ